MSKVFPILAALALTTVALPAAMGQNANQLGLSRHDVSEEIDGETPDQALSSVDNGFEDYDATDNKWHLVLNSHVVPYASQAGQAQPNQVLDELSAGPVDLGNDEYIYPGLADHEAHWGWWNDKGSGGYYQEVSQAPFGTQDADGIIDNGADNHTADVSFSEWQGNNSKCDATDPTCWQETGEWDEFIIRGPNGDVANDRHTYVQNPGNTGDDPAIENTSEDELFAFVQPGTHASWFSTTTGREDSSNPVRTPGYGVVSQGADETFDVEWPLSYDTPTWEGQLFFTTDASLLMTTKVVTSANPADDTSATDKKDYTSESAGDNPTRTDVDVYSSLGTSEASVETLYRTAVWDPGNNDGDGNNPDLVHDNGPKGFVKKTYSQTYPSTFKVVRDAAEDQVDKFRGPIGYASDITFGGVFEHEPNEPEDQFTYADYCTGPNDGACGATYIPEPFQGDKEWNDEYYNPNQSWDAYKEGEHAWVDTKNKIGVPFLGNWEGKPGTNVNSLEDSDDQNTAGPGALSTFTRVGSWYDVNTDGWIGDADGPGSCSTEDDPYCQGFRGYEGFGTDDPNDYSHHSANNAISGQAEWEGTCSANVNTTVRPVGTPTNDKGEHAWGTNTPPVGVYIMQSLTAPVTDTTGDVNTPASEEPLLDDPDDERLSNHVQYGPVNMAMFPDSTNCKAGQWFKSTELILPAGSAYYPLKVVTKVNIEGEHLGQGTTGGDDLSEDPSEKVVDVDIIDSWT